MPNIRNPNAVRLELSPDSRVQTNLSGAAISVTGLWVEGDEARGQPIWLAHCDAPIAGTASARS